MRGAVPLAPGARARRRIPTTLSPGCGGVALGDHKGWNIFTTRAAPLTNRRYPMRTKLVTALWPEMKARSSTST